MIKLRFLLLTVMLLVIGTTGMVQAEPTLYGSDIDGNLYTISTSDASATLIGNTGISLLGSLEFASDGTLYGFGSGRAPSLYSIDPLTASATEIGILGSGFYFEGGLAFANDGTAYGTNQGNAYSPYLFNVDLNTGSATNIGLLSSPPHDINGLAWRSDGQLVGLDRETNWLVTIDPATATTTYLNSVSPNVVGNSGGMAVLGDYAYFGTEDDLFSFDLYTGAFTHIGTFDWTSTEQLSGLALVDSAPVPEPGTMLLLGTGLVGLAGFGRKRFLKK